MNTTSFVQIDDTLAFNPGYITRVQFGPGRVSIYFAGGTSISLIDDRLTSFLEWWNNRAIVLTPGSMMTYQLLDENIPGSDGDPRGDDDSLHFIRGQLVPEAPEM